MKKIRKGFILEGKLNEIAIKTSLFPTIVHKGPMTIADLNGKGCGLCFLHAAIGTVSQSEAYLNHPSRKDEIDLN